MKASELCLTGYKAGLSEFGKIKYDNTYPNNVMKYHYAEGFWTCDCLGFLHTLINGFCGNKNQLGGGAVMDDFVNYSNEQTTIYKYGYDVSGNFKNIIPAEMLYMDGHVGLYIGDHIPFNDGRVFNVAECCCNSFGGGGMLTYVDPDGTRRNNKGGYSAGYWEKHAKCVRVDYDDADIIIPDSDKVILTPADILNITNDTFIGVYGNNPEREETLIKQFGVTAHRQVQDILNILYR